MARNQFVVPQFLDVEAKIIGPITARQFLIMLTVLLIEFVIYRIFLSLIFVIGLGIPVLGLGLVFAFAKVNGQPFHFIALNYVQTFRKPRLRVWDKTLSYGDLRIFLDKDEEVVAVPTPKKAPLEQSRLQELTLVVNTGGNYAPDEEESS
ncbi:MAG: PrgI family protein [Candidatus Uhrbacteria bacterium]|nr:PrgI family protein [Candidatus Uhrbacteria bacterium]